MSIYITGQWVAEDDFYNSQADGLFCVDSGGNLWADDCCTIISAGSLDTAKKTNPAVIEVGIKDGAKITVTCTGDHL